MNSTITNGVSGTQEVPTTLQHAERYVAAGISVVPVHLGGAKNPSVGWKPYQQCLPTASELRKWFDRGASFGIAVIAGAVSGNLEVIDFDEADLLAGFVELVEAEEPGLVARLVKIQTPRPGYQLWYRCEGPVEGNLKLARGERPDENGELKIKALIETRGEGGYAIAPGSPPEVHVTGRPYVVLQGDPAEPPMLTSDERAVLFRCARALNEHVEPEQHVNRPLPARGDVAGLRPGDDFNERGDVEGLLRCHGWTCARSRGEASYWCRPGKNGHHAGHSATLGAVGPGVFYVFSSNAAPLEADRAYGPFSLYATLEHQGDFNAAARALAAEGYGEPIGRSDADAPPAEEAYDLAEIEAYLDEQVEQAAAAEPNGDWWLSEPEPDEGLSAVEALPELIQQAKESGDPAVVYDAAPLLSRLPAVEFAKAKAALREALGAKLNLNDLEKAIRNTRQPSRSACPYRATRAGLIWNRQTPEGHVAVPLTNFAARITREIREDDGDERQIVLEIEAHVPGREASRFTLRAEKFEAMDWVLPNLGPRAVVNAGRSIKDHARAAIQALSEPEVSTVYAHLGWTRRAGEWMFLHAGGAIGAAGPVPDIEVSLPRELQRYLLPEPPAGAPLQEAIQRSLGFLGIANYRQSWPLLASAYTAPLAELTPADFVPWIEGPSGTRKTTASIVLSNHFGEFREERDLPANFGDTGNSLEKLLHVAKDALVVVNDYCPKTDPMTGRKQEEAATRLLRNVGNSQGRNRMTRDLRVIGEKPPRCLALVTAETAAPGTQSSEARTITIEWPEDAVDLEALTLIQNHDVPFYRQAMAGYLCWLAARMDELKESLPKQIQDLRRELDPQGQYHGRLATGAAKLYMGASLFLRFGVEVGAVTLQQQQQHQADLREALIHWARETSERQAERSPLEQLRTYLQSAVAQGIAYFSNASSDGVPEEAPLRFGWMCDESRFSASYVTRPNARKIGFVDERLGVVYLLPEACLALANDFARTTGSVFPAGKNTLSAALARAGFIARGSVQGGRERNIIRLWMHGAAGPWVWAVPLAFLYGVDEETQPDGSERLSHAESVDPGTDRNGDPAGALRNGNDHDHPRPPVGAGNGNTHEPSKDERRCGRCTRWFPPGDLTPVHHGPDGTPLPPGHVSHLCPECLEKAQPRIEVPVGGEIRI